MPSERQREPSAKRRAHSPLEDFVLAAANLGQQAMINGHHHAEDSPTVGLQAGQGGPFPIETLGTIQFQRHQTLEPRVHNAPGQILGRIIARQEILRGRYTRPCWASSFKSRRMFVS